MLGEVENIQDLGKATENEIKTTKNLKLEFLKIFIV